MYIIENFQLICGKKVGFVSQLCSHLLEMEKITMMREKAKDIGLKEKIQAVQNDFTLGWRSIADKARKEAKTINKKARKALATYEEGSSVRYDQIYDCDFDTGFYLWLKFQKQWIRIREENVTNSREAEVVDNKIDCMVKDWRKWNASAIELHEHLVSLPDIIAKVEIAQRQIAAISDQVSKIDGLLVEFEDVCQRCEMENEKNKERLQLSQLIEKRQMQFQALKEKNEMTDEESKQMARVLERQESIEKQQVYEDAFMEQMDRYIRYGELDKPIAGSVDHEPAIDDMSFDDADLDALKEFLGPEELNNVLMSQATLASTIEKPVAGIDNGNSCEVEASEDSQALDNSPCSGSRNSQQDVDKDNNTDKAGQPIQCEASSAPNNELTSQIEIESGESEMMPAN